MLHDSIILKWTKFSDFKAHTFIYTYMYSFIYLWRYDIKFLYCIMQSTIEWIVNVKTNSILLVIFGMQRDFMKKLFMQ